MARYHSEQNQEQNQRQGQQRLGFLQEWYGSEERLSLGQSTVVIAGLSLLAWGLFTVIGLTIRAVI